MVLAGGDVRFVATVECVHVLRVGDRTGRTLPAHRSSGGKALLAELGRAALDAALGVLDEQVAGKSRRELRSLRGRGYAVKDQATEPGLTAVGVAVGVAVPGTPGGTPPAAVSRAMPTARYGRDALPVLGSALVAAAKPTAADLCAT